MHNYYKKIKDNLSTIILLPAILGGLWQIIELANISISYIRFFSPTQLLADGLFILSLLVPSYLLFKLALFYKYKHMNLNIYFSQQKSPKYKIIQEQIYDNKKPNFIKYKNPLYSSENYKHYLNEVIINMFILSSVLLLNIYFELFNITYYIGFIIFTSFIITFVSQLIVNFYVLTIIFIESNIYKEFKSYILQTSILKIFIKIFLNLFTFILILFLFLIPFIFISFVHTKTIPTNLKNLNDYLKEINTTKIKYLNDKYIFIEVKNQENNNTDIQIIKLDEIISNK